MEAPAGETTNETTPPEGGSPNASASEPVAPRGLDDLRFTSEDTSEEWMVGKTPKEVARLASEMYAALQRGETREAPAPTTSHTSPPASASGIPSVDPNLIYSNPTEYHRQMEARMEAIANARVNAATPNVFTPMASMAKEQARSHRPDVWKRYGPEIETTMASVNPALRSDVGTWKRAVDIVAGAHVDELAHAKAKEIIARGSDTGTLSGSGGPPTPNSKTGKNAIEKLFIDDHPAIKGFKTDGLSPAKVVEHARKRGYTPEKYAEILTARATRREGAGLR